MRHALRSLAKSPGFTVVALLTLALGIGACTAIFSVVNSVVLRPLAYPDSDRLVVIRETKLPQFPEFSVAPGQYFTWKDEARSFEQLAATRGGSFNLTGAGEPLRVTVSRVTPNYLSTLRTFPALGRDFRPDEDTPGQENVAILLHGFWQRQFGGRQDILGETVQLNGQAYTIVGVMPPDFQPGTRTEILLPAVYTTEERQNHGGHYIGVVGRLKEGVTLEQARAELETIALRLAQQFPDTNTGWGVKLTPMLESAVGDVRPILFSLLGAVGFLLLIACANVANLLLARATARAREFSIRAALGASRRRIVGQLLAESVLLAVLSGAAGVFVAETGMAALLSLAPDTLPRAAEISLDRTALAFAFGVSLLTGIGFGLVPAFQASRIDLNEVLKDSGRGLSAGGRRQRLRSALVVAEVAIALILLVGSGLLIHSFARLQKVNPGFVADHAYAVGLSLPWQKYATDEQRAAFVARAAERLASLPGVQSVGASQVVPFTGGDYILGFLIGGRPPPPPGEARSTNYYAVTPGYFTAMGIPLLSGRFFEERDAAGGPPVAIINESMAKKYFPGENPIGQRIHVTNGPETFREIIGVVADVKHYSVDRETPLQTYEPFAQKPLDFMTLVVRLAPPVPGDPTSAASSASLPAAIRSAIYSIDPDQPVASVRPLSDLLAASMARQRFAMSLFSVFSGVSLLLSAIGIYGVMAYSVTQRTAEIGIRMALGAQRSHVLHLVFAQGGRLIAIGVLVGLAGAFALTRFISSMLFDVSAHDPLTFASIVALLSAVATAACLIPALRATRVDPMTALRSE